MKKEIIKNLFIIILVGVALVGGYILLNKEYEESINSCIQQGNDRAYCEYHAY